MQKEGMTDLPARIGRESRYLHAMDGSARSRWSPFLIGHVSLTVSRATSELDGKSFSHEIRSIFVCRFAG